MGCDALVYVNNNIFENNIEYTLTKLSNLLGVNMFITGKFKKYQRMDNYLNIFIDEFNSINEKFENDKYIIIMTKHLEIYMLENFVNIFCDDIYFNRWSLFSDYLAKDAENDLIEYYNDCFEKLKFCSSVFGSNKLIVFDSYNHQDIEDQMYEGITIEKVLENKRWRIIENIGVSDVGNTDLYELYYNEWEQEKYINKEKWINEYL
jgi:hypothetical protein